MNVANDRIHEFAYEYLYFHCFTLSLYHLLFFFIVIYYEMNPEILKTDVFHSIDKITKLLQHKLLQIDGFTNYKITKQLIV